MIESISYTESGKQNLRLVSKEYAHRELRRMIGGDAQPIQRANDFSSYSDARLFAEIARLANGGDQDHADDRAQDLSRALWLRNPG
jgi:hypothetical protein